LVSLISFLKAPELRFLWMAVFGTAARVIAVFPKVAWTSGKLSLEGTQGAIVLFLVHLKNKGGELYVFGNVSCPARVLFKVFLELRPRSARNQARWIVADVSCGSIFARELVAKVVEVFLVSCGLLPRVAGPFLYEFGDRHCSVQMLLGVVLKGILLIRRMERRSGSRQESRPPLGLMDRRGVTFEH
jgi:hypothetical protein